MAFQGHDDRTDRIDTRPGGCTLITGVTGFVGGELLRRLARTGSKRLVCLVRGESEKDAQRRGQKRLAELVGPCAAEGLAKTERVRWIRADLEKASLGLSEHVFGELSAEIDEIFHCAASVEFNLPLHIAHRINVGGVEKLVALARAAGTRFTRFHHVSTAYVAGRRSGRADAYFLPDDQARNFRNTYERTKARAERYLRDQRDIPVTVYRPSIIAGDTVTGRTDNWNVLYVPMRQIVKGRLPVIRRGGRAIVDTIGVDYVVEGMIALAAHTHAHMKEHPRFQAYHLTAGRLAFDLEFYLDCCNASAQSAGRPGNTRSISPLRWRLWATIVQALAYAPRSMDRVKNIGLAAQPALKSFTPYLAYTSVDVEFDADHEHEILARAGVSMPPPEIYLPRIIEFACEANFGRGLPAAPTARAKGSDPKVQHRKRVSNTRPGTGSGVRLEHPGQPSVAVSQ